jgi:hypothetical protein
MAVYTISNRKTGARIGGLCRTPLGALRTARGLLKASPDQTYTVSEFPTGTNNTGRPVMYVSAIGEANWCGQRLLFWDDKTPII